MPDASRRPPVSVDVPTFRAEPAQVAELFDLGDVRRPPTFAARGELGRIWRFTTSSGDWAVKELLTDDPFDVVELAAERDVEFQRAAHTAGVRMPLPRVRPDGSVVGVLTPPDGSSLALRAYSWMDLAAGPVEASPAAAAEQLGRLHAEPFPDSSAPDPWFREPFDDQRWPALVDAARIAGVPWAEQLAAAQPALVETNAVVQDGGFAPEVRCHLDFNPQNVLLDASGAAVVVDWENSGPATVGQELASAVAEFVPDPADLPAFLTAYLGAGGPAVPLAVADFTMTLAVQAHLLAWYVGRSLDPAVDPEDRQRADYWVTDICRQLFTVQRVQAWVDAARPLMG